MPPTEVAPYLYVSDIRDARMTDLNSYGIDHVIGVCQDSVADSVRCEYSHYDVADTVPAGADPIESEYEQFAQAVDETREVLGVGDTVLVHCHAGQSRSVSVAACTMACEDDAMSLDDAYWKIGRKRQTHVSPDMKLVASKYYNRHLNESFINSGE